MSVLSGIALIMIVLAGYTAGVTLAARGRVVSPRVVDLLLIAVLWIVALLARGTVGRWLSLLIWTPVAIAAGSLLIRGRPVLAQQEPLSVSGRLWRRLWERWKHFGQAMADFQARLLMGYFYFLALTPFGLISRLAGDPLQLRGPADGSGWRRRESDDRLIEEARQQG